MKKVISDLFYSEKLLCKFYQFWVTGVFPFFIRELHRWDPFVVNTFHADKFHYNIHWFQSHIIGKVGSDSERDSYFFPSVIRYFFYFFEI